MRRALNAEWCALLLLLAGVWPSAASASTSVPGVQTSSELTQSEPNQYIVVLKGDASPILLAQRLADAAAAADQGEDVARASSAAGQRPALQILQHLSIGGSSSGSGGPAAAAAAQTNSLSSLVVRAEPHLLPAIRSLDFVTSVIPDFLVRSQADLSAPGATAPRACITLAELQQGVSSAAPAPAAAGGSESVPARCQAADTRLVWFGRPCKADPSLISYTKLVAFIGDSGKIAWAKEGQRCILRREANQPQLNLARLGRCGQAPLIAPDLPTCIASDPPKQPLPEAPPAPDNPGTPPPPAPDTQPPPETSQPPPPPPSAGGTTDNNNNDKRGSDNLAGEERLNLVKSIGDTSSSIPGLVLPRAPLAAGETVPAGVQQIEAANNQLGAVDIFSLPSEQRQLLVAVVDSGVDASHPDLVYAGGKSWIKPSVLPGYENDAEPGVDNHGHGTHVAGTISALNSGQGVVGVVPGTPVFSLKVLNGTGHGTLSTVLAAVAWVLNEGAKSSSVPIRVINLSLSTRIDPTSQDWANAHAYVCNVFAALSEAAVVVVAAAGNSAADFAGGWLPAACPTVAAATAVESRSVASFSNFLGLQLAERQASAEDLAHVIAAPGVGIVSTVPVTRDPTGYKSLSGTSMASAHASGVAVGCVLAGACAADGMTGAQSLAVLLGAAQKRYQDPGSGLPYGFLGDPYSSDSNPDKYYGLLAFARW